MKLAERNDEELARLVATGDEDAFAELVVRHTMKFRRYAAHTLRSLDDADAVVQSAFLKFWQTPSLYDSAKSKFTTWFYRVLRNRCIDLQKSSSRRQHQVGEYCSAIIHAGMMVQQSEENALQARQEALERKIAVEFALSQLGTKQREVINMVSYSGLPQKEVAQILGVSVKAVESLLTRAKKKMAKLVTKHFEDETHTHLDQVIKTGKVQLVRNSEEG